MALVVADRVKQTAATISGTGTYTLSGTFTGFQTFTDGVGDGNTTYYAAVQDANFEIGIGTYTASGTTLARTTILQSSNSDNAVNWSSATPTIFTTYPADKAVFKDASGNINGTFVGNITGNVSGNTSGTAATVTDAAQTNITSVGTLTSLTTSGDITVGDDLTVQGGQIDLRSNSGAVGKMKFYCEVSNAHAQTLQAQPHSAASSAVLVLPTASGTLLGSGDAVSVKNSYLLDTDIKIGEDDQTKIDFETADEIHFYAANVEQVYLADNIFGPQSDSDVDLGTTSVRWKDAYVDSVTVTDNVTIGGNLTVNGTTTTIDTTNTVVKDSLLGLNNGASSNSNDSGIIIERGSTGNDALLIWDESADKWALGTTTDNASSTGNLNMTTGTLVANIEGNVTGNLTGNADTATKVYVDESEDDNLFYNIIFENTHPASNGYSSMQVDDNGLQFNPGTNTLAVTNTTTTLGTAAQPNITSVGTLTGLTTSGRIIVDDTTEATTTTDGSIQTDGGLSVAKDIVVGDDIKVGDDIAFTSDGAVLYFGADSEVRLYHVHNDGLKLYNDNQLQFGDSGTYIHQSADGVLDLVSDNEIEINATTIDMNGNLDVSGSLTLGGTAITSTAAELNILDGVTATASELNIMDGVTSTTAELNILDGVTATASELNLLDGGTSVGSSITVADSDGIVVNDGGTMKTIPASDIKTYAAGSSATKGFATAMAIAL